MHKLIMLVLLETKMKDHKKLIEDLGFDDQIQSETRGLSGEIVIMQKENTFKVEDISISNQDIHVMVKVLSSSHFGYSLLSMSVMTLVLETTFGKIWLESPKPIKETGLLKETSIKSSKPGRNIEVTILIAKRAELFWQCLNQCNMVDLGFKGRKFT